MRSSYRRHAAVLVALWVACGASAFAQGAKQPPKPTPPAKPAAKVKKDPKWTFEVFGGAAFAGSTGGDATADFPAGASFTTEAGLPSRVVPSWYFGDGAVLFNQVRAQFASVFNVTFPQIVSLDPVFAGSSFERGGGGAFGIRVGRRLSPRYSLEFGLQGTRGTLSVSESALGAIEASRASFDQAFRGLIGTIPQAGMQVSSTATIPETTNVSQTAITAVLNIALSKKTQGLVPYVSVGMGRVSNSAETMTVQLRGNYQFRFFDSNPFNESDSVSIRTSDRESVTVGVLGGGATYNLSARQGLRFDARVLLGTSGIVTELDAGPTSATGTPVLALPSNTNPSIQFSNVATLKSSLSGRISDQTVFSGSGIDGRFQLTAGYFFRF